MKKPLLSEIYDNDAKHVSREKEATSEAQTGNYSNERLNPIRLGNWEHYEHIYFLFF